MILLSISLAHGQEFKPKYSTILDVRHGPSLMSQCSRSTPDHVADYWKLTAEDVAILERNLKNITKLKSKGCCIAGLRITDPADYAYQYIGVVIRKQRYIYINAFAYSSDEWLEQFIPRWQTEPLVVCDGGDGFWGAIFNPDNGKFSQLSINGI